MWQDREHGREHGMRMIWKEAHDEVISVILMDSGLCQIFL